MVQRLKQQLANGVQWAKEQAESNPLGTLVVAGFAIWFVVTLWITIRAERLGLNGKTFWDWLELLVVPLVLAFGALWFNASQKRTEIAIADDKQQQATLEAYYDRMADLLLNHDLRNMEDQEDRDEARSIARARTLTVLLSLDSERKGQVVKFLYESRLVNREQAVIDLHDADLEGANLHEANLSGANLNGVNLNGANLNGAELIRAELSGAYLDKARLYWADLEEAYLEGASFKWASLSRAHLVRANLSDAVLSEAEMVQAYLTGAFLSGAELVGANLLGVNLIGADLSFADLSGANLSGADLSAANLLWAKGWTPEQLQQALTLTNATMPDGTKYEEWMKKQETQQPQG